MNRDVLERAQRGDRAAQRVLLAEAGPRLAALVRRLGLPGEQDDALQALFAHVLEVLPAFDPDGPAQLTTWLHTVATRWLLQQRRRARPDVVSLDEEGVEEPASSAPDAVAVAEGRSLEAALESALGRLPAPQRRAFVLLQLEQLDLATAAEAEGVPVGTMKSRLHRARAALAVALGALLDRPTGGAP